MSQVSQSWARTTLLLLSVALMGVGAVQAQDPQDPPEWGESPNLWRLAQRWTHAYQAKDWEKAIEVGLEIARLDPKEDVVRYNLACVYALNGQKRNALSWLRNSAELGFCNLTLFEKDPDLKSLRAEPAYRECLKLVRKNAARDREKFFEKVEVTEPVIKIPEGIPDGKALPVIVALHPYGGTPEAISKRFQGVAAKRGAILLAPRAIHQVESGYDWGAPEDTLMVITHSLEKLAKLHKIDPKKVVLAGFSQGGNMALYLGSKRPDLFCGVIAVAGCYKEKILLPDMDCKRLPPIYLMVGADDPLLHCNKKAQSDLIKAGFSVNLKVYRGLGHAFPENYDLELKKALNVVMPKPANKGY